MMMRSRLLATVAFVVAAVGLTVWLAPRVIPGLRSGAPPRAAAGHLPRLDAPVWLNAPASQADSLPGHVVALLVWCDTDPASLAALPVVEAWRAGYGRLGARVLSVHAPDFAFGADSTVAARVLRQLGLELPTALDPAGQLQQSLGGATDGPHLIVADTDGSILLDGSGSQALGSAESALRTALRRTRPDAAPPPPVRVPVLPESRTVYLGSSRVVGGPLRGLAPGRTQTFTTQFRYQEQGDLDTPFPVGTWTPSAEGLVSAAGGAANFVAIRYAAARVGVVLSPLPGSRSRVWFLIDDKWPAAAALEADAHADGRGAAYVDVTEPRLYWLENGRGERVLKLSPEVTGVTVHAFVLESAVTSNP